jgi:signal transduction histidine kinase
MAMMAAVLLIGLNFTPVELTERFSVTQLVLAWILTCFFMTYIAYLVNRTTRNFVTARHQLQEKNQQVMEQSQQLGSIAKVARLVNSTLDIDQVIQTVQEQLSGVFSFTQMAILFVNKERQTLTLDRISGNLPAELMERLQGTDIPLSERNSIFALTVVKKTPFYLPDVSREIGETEGNTALVYEFIPAKSLLTYPLIKDEEVVGVLVFVNTEENFELDKEKIDQIEQYVTYVVSALSNARNYREIMEARKAADNANKAKSQFLANMSHELRTPMNAIIGFSEVLNDRIFGELNDKQAEYLTDINAAGQHLLSLINDVLDLSKIEAGRLELATAEFDLPATISDAMAMMKDRASSCGVSLNADIGDDVGMISADQRLVKQVLLNLLSNAVKFTLEGGSVSLQARNAGEHVEIAVEDTGIGIKEDELETMFEEFIQSGDEYTRTQEGTGLGLALSKRLVELHGGTIHAKSEPGMGSTFIFTLPINGIEQHEETGENNGR